MMRRKYRTLPLFQRQNESQQTDNLAVGLIEFSTRLLSIFKAPSYIYAIRLCHLANIYDIAFPKGLFGRVVFKLSYRYFPSSLKIGNASFNFNSLIQFAISST